MNDFDRWRSDFVSSLDLNYNFNEHIETCEQYIEEIIQYNIIKYVGPEKTNSFLTETLKFAIYQIMNFRINNSNRLKCGILIHFLKLTTALIPYSFLNDIFDLFPILESILDSTHPFYQSLKTGNNTIQQLNVIKQYIVSHEMLALMATRIQKNEETPITATHFIFFFNLFSILSDLMNSNTKSSLLFTIFPVFSEFINDISNYDIKDINAEEVELLFNSAIKILIATDEFSDEILSSIVEFPMEMFQRDSLEFQMLGIRIFSQFLEAPNHITQEFFTILSNDLFVTKILTQDCHQEIVNQMIPIIMKMASVNLITPEELSNIWNNTFSLESREKKLLQNTVSDILISMPFEKVKVFFSSIFESPDQTTDFFLDVSNIVVNFFSSRKSAPSDIVSFVFSLIFEYPRNSKKANTVIKNLSKLYSNENSKIFREKIIEIAKNTLKKHYSDFVIQLLINILNDSSVNYSNNLPPSAGRCLDESFILIIEGFISSNTETQSILPLYSILLCYYHKTINSNIMKKILENPNDATWDFLIQLLEKTRLDGFDLDSIGVISEFILQYNHFESDLYLYFLKLFILFNNIRCKMIRSLGDISSNLPIPKRFDVYRIPLLGQEVIIKVILEAKSDQIAYQACEIFLFFFNQLRVHEEVLSIIQNLYDNSKNDQQFMRSIFLMKEYCQKFDDEQKMIVFSHKTILSTIQDSINNIVIQVKTPDNNEVRLEIQEGSRANKILVIIAPYLPKSIKNYTIEFENKTISPTSVINESFSKSPLLIIEKRQSTPGFTSDCLPSEILDQCQFPHILFDNLNRHIDQKIIQSIDNSIDHSDYSDKLNEKIFELLSYLPSDDVLFELTNNIEETQKLLYSVCNKYSLRYFLQIIFWRMKCPKYAKMYSTFLISYFLNIFRDRNSAIYLADELILIIGLIFDNSTSNNELLLPMFELLSYQTVSPGTKINIARIFQKIDNFKISEIIYFDDLKLLHKVLFNITKEVWDVLKPCILKSSASEIFFSESLQVLLRKKSQFHSEIFVYFLPKLSFDSASLNIDLLIQILKRNQNTEIAQSIQKMIKNYETSNKLDPNTNFQIIEVIKSLIMAVQECTNMDVMTILYETITYLASLSDKTRNIQNEFIEKIVNYNFLKWSFMPDSISANYSDTNFLYQFKGIRNLGATCYMNSALQQLFYIPAFRYLASKAEPDHFIPSLQNLIYRMEYTKRKYVDPDIFFHEFSNKHCGIFAVGEQQDSQEFIQFFLDDLPKDVHNLFEGVIENTTYELSTGKLISHQDESFISLPLSVEYHNIQESLKGFFKNQLFRGENKYQTNDGDKIEAKAVPKLKKSPDILILQLKRFHYDTRTKERAKINSKFVFSNDISLNDFMVNNTGGENYILNGVVVHRGNGMHGHYTSLINSNGKWLKFDDTEVNEIDQQTFENEAFGNDSNAMNNQLYEGMNNINGYIIFYIKNNSTLTLKNEDGSENQININDDSLHSIIPDDIRNEIEEENRMYLYEQCIFDQPTLNYIVQQASPLQNLLYFFKVFCHSKLTHFIPDITKKIISVSQDEAFSSLIFLTENFQSLVFPVFNQCNVAEMTKAASDIIVRLITLVFSTRLENIQPEQVQAGGELVFSFISCLKKLVPKWHQIHEIGHLINQFLDITIVALNYAITSNWVVPLVEFVLYVYDGSRSDSVLQITDISSIFIILTLIISYKDKDFSHLIKNLLRINQMVKWSKAYSCYKNMILKCLECNLFSIEEISRELPDEFTRSKVISYQIQKATPETFQQVFHSLISQRIEPNEIYTELSKFYPNNHKLILENLDFVASLLSQQGADMLGYLLERIDFNDNERMELYNEMKNIIASDHIIIENIDLFFSIVNILVQKLKIDFQSEIGDNNEVIKGLEKYEKYSSLELLKLQSKLKPEKLIDIFESTFAEITSDQHNFYGHIFNNLDNKLSDMLTYFGELDNDDVLKQIYSSDKWPKIIDTCIKTNQTDSLVKIADFITKKPITSESRKVLFLIFTGSHELNHVVKFSSHISSFLPYSNSEEVFGLFNIIVILMNDPSRNREKDLAFQTLISAFMNFISSHKNEERLKELYILPELALKHAVLIRDSMFLIYVNFLSLIAELNKTFCIHIIELLISKFNNPKKEDDLFVFAAIRFKLYFCEKGTSKDAILTSLRFIYDKAAKGFIQQNQNLFFLVLTSTKFEDWIIDFAESVFLDPAIPISSPKEEEWLIKAIKLMKGEKIDHLVENTKNFTNNDQFSKLNEISQKNKIIDQLERFNILIKSVPDTREGITKFLLPERESLKRYSHSKIDKLVKDIFIDD